MNGKRKESLTGYQKYKEECKFKFNVYAYPNEFNLLLIQKFKWYKVPKWKNNFNSNLNGISRDHKISIKYGWKNNISSNIISHPTNCELMRHKNNQRKYTKCSITLKELKNNIKEWDKKYK